MRNIALLILVAAMVFVQIPVAGADGLILERSNHSVSETLNRLAATLRANGLKIFGRIDHGAGANAVGVPLRPTELLIFGNPKLGSQLSISNQKAAIDLPMKALAWEDTDGRVWLAYNDPQYIANRHGIKDRAEVVEKMRGALKKFVGQATAP